jgi:toxin ParE1/3/4
MTPRIVRRIAAKRDVARIASFIAEDSLDAAERFLEAAEASFIALARMPHMGASRRFRNPKFAAVRMWPIKDFENYLIFYRPVEPGIEVLRVVHGARNIEALFRFTPDA